MTRLVLNYWESYVGNHRTEKMIHRKHMKKIRKLACGLANVAAALTMLGLNSEVLAATPLLSFGFNEPSTEEVTDSVNGLTGTPTENAPRLIGDSPSGDGRDRAIHFESGQYITVQDPDTAFCFKG